MAAGEATDERKETMMRLVAEQLQDRAYKQVDELTGPEAFRALQEVVARIADPELRQEVYDAALSYAVEREEAALYVGFRMAHDPGAWLFIDDAV